MEQTPCNWPTTWPERRGTKRYVDTLISSRIETGTKCGGVVGQAFDSEGLLGNISGVGTHGEVYDGESDVRGIPICE